MIQLAADTILPPATGRPGPPPALSGPAFALPDAAATDGKPAADPLGERQDDAAAGSAMPVATAPMPDPALLALFLPPATAGQPAPDAKADDADVPAVTSPAAAPGSMTATTPAQSLPMPAPLPAPDVAGRTRLPIDGSRPLPPTDAALPELRGAVGSPPAMPVATFAQPPAAPRRATDLAVGMPADIASGWTPPTIPAPVPLPAHWQVATGPYLAAVPPRTPGGAPSTAAEVSIPIADTPQQATTTAGPVAKHPVRSDPLETIAEQVPAQPAVSATASLAAPSTAAAATPAAPAPPAARLDMAQERWPEAMIAHIERLRDAADAADTRIRLHPDALGAVGVAVRRDGDRIDVRFTADQPQTRALLQDAQPRLAEAAEARGLRLGQSSVDAGTAGGGQQRPPAPPHRPAPQLSPRTASARHDTAPDDARIA